MLFLLAAQLIGIFTKGMLGLSTGDQIDLPTAALSIFLIILVVFINVKGHVAIRNFSILIGIVTGWIIYAIFFPAQPTEVVLQQSFSIFFLGGSQLLV